MKCEQCGTSLQDGVLFCRECGAKVVKKKRFCRECGAKLEEGAKFCSNCGMKVDLEFVRVEQEELDGEKSSNENDQGNGEEKNTLEYEQISGGEIKAFKKQV